MRTMQTLRRFTMLTRLVLAWFVLSFGIALAAPVITAQNILLVCTGTGVMKVLIQNEDGSTTEQVHSRMDCPLCATMAAPPPQPGAAVRPSCALSYALQGVPAAFIAARTASPMPARGPPALS
jgi:hypothetical protein